MKVKTIKDKKEKMSVKQKFALGVFMESVPKLIDLWKRSECYPFKSFDMWLMDIYTQEKQRKEQSKV